MVAGVTVRRLESLGEREIAGLSDVLIDCVAGGASVSFMLPMTRAKADLFWRGVAAAVERDERMVFVAQDEAGRIVGTVQLLLNLPENQPHRGDVAKMLVHRDARCRGIGSALMGAAERAAREAGRWLLVLDTASGAAERLYTREGWQRCGVIPEYALWPGGGTCQTTVFFKFLRNGPGPS